MSSPLRLDLGHLTQRFAADPSEAERVLRDVHARVASSAAEIWIHRPSLDAVLAQLRSAEERCARGEALPLFGVPFAVKDNIDVAGMPTTAACPAFEHVPSRSATVVERLLAAGAIVVGKTNLDQFATGLVGVRSPYGACKNPFDERYISGGSSSGSAVAVATGLVSFSLGTDTAGSGRVPAALTNIVGLKPTRGLVSTRGVVPACRTLDCVSFFAGSARDAQAVLDVCAGFDAEDPYSRRVTPAAPFHGGIRFGVPGPELLEFFGDAEAKRLYAESVSRLERLGATRVEIDFAPFRDAAALLYSGPWVAERLHAAGKLLAERPDALDPTVRGILEKARAITAQSAFEGEYRLATLHRAAEAEWKKMDVLLLPTTPTTHTIADVGREPVRLNSGLGYYTNFLNLLDLSGIAVPSGFRADGLPLGVTLVGPSGSDRSLTALGARLHAALGGTVGTTGLPVIQESPAEPATEELLLAVAGAHLSGQPLNHQLTTRSARLVRTCRTSPEYRFYALQGTVPPKPGLVLEAGFEGPGIEVEVWALDAAAFGRFVDEVPAPLAIGSLVLEDGSVVNGFVCEPYALGQATEITSHGGWRRYRASVAAAPST